MSLWSKKESVGSDNLVSDSFVSDNFESSGSVRTETFAETFWLDCFGWSFFGRSSSSDEDESEEESDEDEDELEELELDVSGIFGKSDKSKNIFRVNFYLQQPFCGSLNFTPLKINVGKSYT